MNFEQSKLSGIPDIASPTETEFGNAKGNGFSLEKKLEMGSLEVDLAQWIEDACRESPPVPERFSRLNALFRRIYRDRRFWCYRKADNHSYYEDALNKMWIYFVTNLCEATDGRQNPSFESMRQYAVGRLLVSLKGNLKTLGMGKSQEAKRFKDGYDPEGNSMQPEEYLPAPTAITVGACDRYLELINQDPTGELRATYVRGRPDVNMQVYLQLQYQGMKDVEIAAALNTSTGTISGGLQRPTSWQAKARDWKRKLAEMALDAASNRDE
jgi:hypothetical protein